MTSKYERWSRISGITNNSESTVNPNKAQIVSELATANIPTIKPEAVKSDDVKPDVMPDDIKPKSENSSKSNTTKEESNSKNKNKASTSRVGVKSRSTKSTPKNKEEEIDSSNERFTDKVNQSVRQLIETKQTKEDTHKKTSFLIRLDLLAKLENFDEAHGGRMKGNFINYLLEEAFEEFEQDENWSNILNKDIDSQIEKLKRKR